MIRSDVLVTGGASSGPPAGTQHGFPAVSSEPEPSEPGAGGLHTITVKEIKVLITGAS